MKKGKHKIVAFAFCMITLLPVLTIAFLQLEKIYLHSTREQRLQSGKSEQLVVPVDAIVWEEQGKELRVGNKLFDVSSFYFVDDKFVFTGVFDDTENELEYALLHAFGAENGDDFLQLLLMLQCFAGILLFLYGISQYKGLQKFFNLYLFQLTAPFRLILAPPPRG